MKTLRIWFAALRPISFTASVIPVLVGTAIAATDEFHPGLFVLALGIMPLRRTPGNWAWLAGGLALSVATAVVQLTS